MTDSQTALRDKLRGLIGQPTGGTGKPSVAPDPVNEPMIRHWAHALDDMNPVYLDPEFAASSRFGGIVSPPVMLQTWVMPPPKLEGIRDAAARQSKSTAIQRHSSTRPGIPARWQPTRSSKSNAIPG